MLKPKAVIAVQHLLSSQGKPAWIAMAQKEDIHIFVTYYAFAPLVNLSQPPRKMHAMFTANVTLTIVLPVCLRRIYSTGGVPHHCHFPFPFKTPLLVLGFYTFMQPSMLHFSFSFLFLWSNPPQFKLNSLPLSGWKDLLRITLGYVNQLEQKWLLISYQFRCWLVLVVFWPLLDLT